MTDYKERFIESNDAMTEHPVLLIADIHYWMENEVELANWLAENTEHGLYTQEGMVLTFASREEMMWFILRWA